MKAVGGGLLFVGPRHWWDDVQDDRPSSNDVGASIGGFFGNVVGGVVQPLILPAVIILAALYLVKK